MPEEDNKILQYNHGEKSIKVPFIIYADLESLLEKMNTCHNNLAKSSAAKINIHTPSGYSFFAHIKTEDFYKDIANDVEKRFDTSNYEVNRPLPKERIKK